MSDRCLGTKQTLRFLHYLIEILPQSVYWKDTQLVYRGCNLNFAELVGLTAPEAIIGKMDHDLPRQFHTDTNPFFQQQDANVIAGDRIHDEDAVLTLPDGRVRQMRIGKSPVFDEEDKIIGLVSYVTDVSHFKEIERLLAQQHQREFCQHLQLTRELSAQWVRDLEPASKALETIRQQPLHTLTRAEQQATQNTINQLIMRIKQHHQHDESLFQNTRPQPELLPWLFSTAILAYSEVTPFKQHVDYDYRIAIEAMMAVVAVDDQCFQLMLTDLLDVIREKVEANNGDHPQPPIRFSIALVLNYASLEIAYHGTLPDHDHSAMVKAGYFAQRFQGTLDKVQHNPEQATISLQLPLVESPPWLLQQLVIPVTAQVLILSSDSSVHHEWRQRFQPYHDIIVKHYYDADQFFQTIIDKVPRFRVLLIDHELGDSRNGLQIIEQFKLGQMAILVTNLDPGDTVKQRIQALGVRCLPRFMISNLPILLEQERR